MGIEANFVIVNANELVTLKGSSDKPVFYFFSTCFNKEIFYETFWR